MTDHLKKHSEGTHNYCGICNKGLFKKYSILHHIRGHLRNAIPKVNHFAIKAFRSPPFVFLKCLQRLSDIVPN